MCDWTDTFEAKDLCIEVAKSVMNGRLKAIDNVNSAFGPISIKPIRPHIEILNMPFDANHEELKKMFEEHGKVIAIRFIYKYGENSLCGHLTFENEDSIEKSLAEDNREVDEVRISVKRYASDCVSYESDDEPKGAKRKRNEPNDFDSDWGAGGQSNDFGGYGMRGRGGPRGGGGGGRGGARTCNFCREEGHIARECPKGGSKFGPRACFNCGEDGHMSRDCSKPRNGGRGRGRGGGGRARNEDTHQNASNWESDAQNNNTESNNSAPLEW